MPKTPQTGLEKQFLNIRQSIAVEPLAIAQSVAVD